MTGYLAQAFIYLCAAVIAVPLAKRLGMGSVLGYLVAGVIIGPVVGLVGEETETLQHFAEFGVVMMLFLVGLELEPKMLWSMRNKLIGLGGLQVGLTSMAIFAVVLLFGLDWRIALAIGLVLSLSSTAIVLQSLSEKGLAKTEGGRNAFSVLLFQDIAVIPMLALIPLLQIPELLAQGTGAAGHGGGHGDSVIGHLAGWQYALVVIGAISGVIVGGHFFSRPMFRYVASSGLREVFTAMALMLVIGIAALMGYVGLSPALGTFLAGVVLATSEFRHELEANIEPFKGLLLGLFFITVGAGINFAALGENLGLVLGATLAVMLVKALVLLVLAVLFRSGASDRWLLTLSLAQAGEFGFVLLAFCVQNSVLPQHIAQLLSLVVALSMFLTPALFIFFDKVILPRMERTANEQQPDEIDEQGTVLIAGSGRFGQIVNRMLVANGIATTVLDHEVQQIENMRSIEIKSYFGDATRMELLETAGIAHAAMLVVAIDDKVRAAELVEQVNNHFPDLPVLARAYDRAHDYELQQAGATFTVKETYHSALAMAREALKQLGVHPFRAEQCKNGFKRVEQEHEPGLYRTWLETTREEGAQASYRKLFIELGKELKQVMGQDRSDRHARSERGWTPPPKGYSDKLVSKLIKEKNP